MMLRLARRNLVRHPATYVASFVALALAALVVTVCGGLLETGIRADVPPQRLRGVPVVVAGTQSYLDEPLRERVLVPARVVAHVRALPGVARAVAETDVPLTVGRAVPPTRNWSAAAVSGSHLVAGGPPRRADDVVLDRSLASRAHAALGDRIPTTLRGRPAALRVTGFTQGRGPASAYLSDARAAADTGGTATLLAVYPARGTSGAALAARLRRGLGAPARAGVEVFTGHDRGLAESPDAAARSTDLVPLAAASGGLMTTVAAFIVASTLALTVTGRRRQIALLRAAGATPRQLRRLLVGETVLLAVPASVPAVLAGAVLGRRLLALFADHGVVSDRLVHHQGLIPTLVGPAAAVLTGVVAALVASRRATRVRPVEALGAEATPQRSLTWARALFGGLAFAGALALAIITATAFDGPIAASTAAPSAMLWAIALALLAPVVARPVLAALGRCAAWIAPRTGRLAMLTVRGRADRAAAVAVPVMLAAGLTTTLLYLQTTQADATRHAYAAQLRADLVVTAPGGLDPALADTARRVPEVAAASPLVTSSGFLEPAPATGKDDDEPDADDIPLTGLDAAAARRVTDYPVAAGDLTRLTGDTVALPAEERTAGRDLGDTVAVRFGDNASRRLRVVAVVDERRGYPTLLLPDRLLAAHTTTGLADQLLVRTTGDPRAVRARLAAALPGARVHDRAATLDAFAEDEQTGQWVSNLVIAALTAYTAIALINTVVAATAQRRPQLRLLRLAGATRRQITRAMTAEASVAAGAGLVLGAGVALATLLPFDSALGTPGLPAGSPWIVVAAAGTTVGLTLLVSRLATRRVVATVQP